jgi:hypothetical protein
VVVHPAVVALQEEAVRRLAADCLEAAALRQAGAHLEEEDQRPAGALQVAEGLHQVDVRQVVAVQRREEADPERQVGGQHLGEEDRRRREADQHRVGEDLCRQRKTSNNNNKPRRATGSECHLCCWLQGVGWHPSSGCSSGWIHTDPGRRCCGGGPPRAAASSRAKSSTGGCNTHSHSNTNANGVSDLLHRSFLLLLLCSAAGCAVECMSRTLAPARAGCRPAMSANARWSWELQPQIEAVTHSRREAELPETEKHTEDH